MCWFNAGPALQTLAQHWTNTVLIYCIWGITHQTWYIEPMLDKCWATVYDYGPTLMQHWLNDCCIWGINKRHRCGTSYTVTVDMVIREVLIFANFATTKISQKLLLCALPITKIDKSRILDFVKSLEITNSQKSKHAKITISTVMSITESVHPETS